MEDSLAKIRPHTSSSLQHQKRPATLLVVLENTFKEQNTEPSPTAYFAALLTTLDGIVQRNETSLEEGDLLPAELYLLALVLPFVPTPVVRTHLNTLLSLTSPLFPALSSHAPPLRSQLSIYQSILKTLDKSQLDIQAIRQSFASILQLCMDHRPKVRRKAADVIRDVLAAPPAPLSCHPYAEPVVDWVKRTLTEVSGGPFSKAKSGKTSESPGAEIAIHVLTLLRPVLSNLPPSSLPAITTLLLSLPRLGNPYLSQSVYSVLSDLFALSLADTSNYIGHQIPDVLSIVLASPPPKSDIALSPSWVQVLGDAMLAYNKSDPASCANELGKVWKIVWNYLDSNDALTRKATVQSLDSLCRCFTPSTISSAIGDEECRSTLQKIIAQVAKALDSLAYARSIPEVLNIVSSMITNLSYRPAGSRRSPTAAESLLLPLIVKVGEMRTSKGFEHKEKADVTLATAMRILGPEVLFNALPLNLEPSDRQAGREPRAYLLPLLTQMHPSPLSHFISYFVPLSERMFDLQQKAETEGRPSEAKVWSVLIAQIWSGFVGYCSAAPDLKESLTPTFSQLLSQLLYTQTDLRPSILKGFKVMIETNLALASSVHADEMLSSITISSDEASTNLDFLGTQAESWLAVFFNVFSSVGNDSRGMVGDVISAWASIAGQQEITKAYQKVVDLFKTNLATSPLAAAENARSGNMTATTQDILILLLPNLSTMDANALFQLCLSEEVLLAKVNAVQKRGYKILSKLLETGKVPVNDAPFLLKKLDDFLDGIAQAAKKDRFILMALLIPFIPSDSLHIIPSLIPEAVLGTKEPSEKARSAAFDLIIAMGKKMSEGGIVRRSLVDGMDEDISTSGDAMASIEEFMTMIAGGLAGASPHMISATVTAISRLVFEYKDSIPPKMHNEIFSTMLVFLSSANREIVKSVLGFIKLCIHTLPAEFVRPHLKELVPALLRWSHSHANHFKAKVRHIFERMIRRFDWDEIYGCASGDEAAKVLVNIKKRKERAKRKKANAKEEEDGTEVPSAKPTAGNAFEDVLYGSESEVDDSDDDVSNIHDAAPKKSHQFRARIRIDDDEPMDLLSGAATRVTNTSSVRQRKPGQDATYFKADEETGKMIIDEEDSDEEEKNVDDVAGNAYRENLTSVDGFTRDRGGRVKFNKDTKKRRREELEEDVEMADETTGIKAKKGKKKTEASKLGHTFKAKKAGGDVKKGGIDPYAYMTLADAARKKGRGAKIGIAGKR
ncbi:hypothetical protein AX17_001459 [Amanita inopinata Kibby_2008]|nr:hypothetical protein AX17_001459 [Amanita inopinata Kibby_2008]